MTGAGSAESPPGGGRLPIACGYLRRGEGTKVSADQLKEQITSHARRLGFALYSPIFVDTALDGPMERPALRVLLDIVWELHVPAVITPSIWHLSQTEAEADQVRQRLATFDCRLILIR